MKWERHSDVAGEWQLQDYWQQMSHRSEFQRRKDYGQLKINKDQLSLRILHRSDIHYYYVHVGHKKFTFICRCNIITYWGGESKRDLAVSSLVTVSNHQGVDNGANGISLWGERLLWVTACVCVCIVYSMCAHLCFCAQLCMCVCFMCVEGET